MRIVLLPSNYAPAIGGIEEVTRQLGKRLVSGGDDVEIWTHRHPPTLPDEEVIGGLTVRRFRFPLPSARPASLTGWPRAAGSTQRAMAGAVRRFRPDVLHVHGFSGNGVHATLASVAHRTPLVVTLHGETSTDDHRIYDRSLSLRTGIRAGLRRAAAVTAPSRFILEDASRFGLREARTRVIPNGVDLLEATPPADFSAPFPRYVFALGRLVPNKGFDLLVRSLAPLLADRPDVGLVIAGDGPERDALLALADDLGVGERVRLVGWLDRGQVGAAMENAAVFALSSRVESFGVVVLEAMRAGAPVVATSRGGVREWVQDGVSAILADPLDVAQLTAALQKILDDSGLARDLVAAGRRQVVDFDWNAVGGRYRDLYAEVLAR